MATPSNENAAPPSANLACTGVDTMRKAEVQKAAAPSLKRPAQDGQSEPAPKRSRFVSWLGGPSRVLSALSHGCGTLLSNIKAVPSEETMHVQESSSQGPVVVFFDDPRETGKKVGVVAFHHPGQDDACDILCGAGFLSNSADLGEERLRLRAPSHQSTACFSTAEAAFQALRFWKHASKFESLSAGEALDLRKQLSGKEDVTFGGYQERWAAMLAVLRAKFMTTKLKAALLKTGDAFLLDNDGLQGNGTDCLGLQLMLIRDELGGRNDWTEYIGARIDLRTGKPKNAASMEAWMAIVQQAGKQVMDILKARQMIAPAQRGAFKESGGHAQKKAMEGGIEAAPLQASKHPSLPQGIQAMKGAQEPVQVKADLVAKGSTAAASDPCRQRCVESARGSEKVAAVGTTTQSLRVNLPRSDLPRDLRSGELQKSTNRLRFADDVEACSFPELLRIQPEREIRFARGTTSTAVVLENISQRNVAFKFKASTRDCLARPMTGTLQPGERQEVRLSLASNFGRQAVSEKYVIQAMPVESPAALSRDEWAARGKALVHEQRLAALRDAA